MAPSETLKSENRNNLPRKLWSARLIWVALLLNAIFFAFGFRAMQLNEHQQVLLAQQNLTTSGQAQEARSLAKDAFELARDANLKLIAAESRFAEISANRNQSENLLLDVQRLRNEIFIESTEGLLRLSEAQAKFSGSPDAIIIALKNTSERLADYTGKKKAELSQAILFDLEQLRQRPESDFHITDRKLQSLNTMLAETTLNNWHSGSGLSNNSDKIGAQLSQLHEDPVDGLLNQNWWQRFLHNIAQDFRNLVQIRTKNNNFEFIASAEEQRMLELQMRLHATQALVAFRSGNLTHALQQLKIIEQQFLIYVEPTVSQEILGILKSIVAQLGAQLDLAPLDRLHTFRVLDSILGR